MGKVMTRKALLMLAAAAALAGCNKESHTIVAGPPTYDDDVNAVANANVQLPPSIIATKIYRCADNAVVTVNYLSDNKSANVQAEKGASLVRVTTDDPAKPMTAEGGYSVEGSPTSGTAKITVPGHPAQSCTA
jgi:uncharacterized lipoprotein YajG